MSEDSTGTPEFAVAPRDEAERYGSYYYEHCCGTPYERTPDWLGLFARFADRIVEEIQPDSVLDAGCAMGLLVDALVDRGIDAYGVDISDFAIERVHESVRDRCRVGSILEPFDRRYSLIVTIEVLEHLKPLDAEAAVANLCAHADDILFSSTPFDYNEATHFNVQPPEYWAVLFARHGFVRDLDYDASYITRWATRFRKTEMKPWRLVLGYERKIWRLQQENLGARESLVDHQDRLMASETKLSLANAKLDPLVQNLEGLILSHRDTESLLRAEIQRVFDEGQKIVHKYQVHVEALDQHVRNLNRENDLQRDRSSSLEAMLNHERVASECREQSLLATRQTLVEELAAIHSSRAWRFVATLSRWKTKMLVWRRGPSHANEGRGGPGPHLPSRPSRVVPPASADSRA